MDRGQQPEEASTGEEDKTRRRGFFWREVGGWVGGWLSWVGRGGEGGWNEVLDLYGWVGGWVGGWVTCERFEGLEDRDDGVSGLLLERGGFVLDEAAGHVCEGSGWVGGWVGGWVVCFSSFQMRCWTLWVGGWVGEKEKMLDSLSAWVGGWVGGWGT